jgi:WD40 repeat protein
VYVASEDSTIKVFSTVTKEKEGELKGHEDAVLDLTWDNSKDSYLISSAADCSFRLW